MSATDALLANADAYAAGFERGDLPLPPGRKVAVLACMDARLNPYGILGLDEGDAHVIRNAGGVVSDEGWTAHAFGDLEADVRDGIAKLKASPFIPRKDSVRGFVYDVKTGALTEVS